MVSLIALTAAAIFTLVSCGGSRIQSVDRENLFRLDIGRLEDQIDLFGMEGRRSNSKTRIAMRDGLFFISDGNGAKVVRYTSYGDLLSMIYDPETNPPPLSLKTGLDSSELITRRAVSYPLNEPGELAVDSRKHLYVEDRLPPERRSFDADRRNLLDSTVLRFDGEGRFVEYLGQEGIGGTPFPRIYGIFPSQDDEIAVVGRLIAGWNVYWFDKDGAALFLVRIRSEDLPIPDDRGGRPSLDSIYAAPDARKLYLKIDYYQDTYDESTRTKSGIAYDGSIIWVMNVETGAYEHRIDVPIFERTVTENNQRIKMDLMYTMIGAAKNGKVFLSVPDLGGYDLLMLETGSREQKRGFIRVDDDELAFNAFHLSADGILSALLATEWEAKVVWWRTDRFMGEIRQ